MKGKKGFNIGDLGGLALSLGVAVIIITFVAVLLAQLQYTQSPGVATGVNYSNAAYNIAGKGLEATGTFGDWMPTIALVIVFAVILGIVIYYMSFKKQ